MRNIWHVLLEFNIEGVRMRLMCYIAVCHYQQMRFFFSSFSGKFSYCLSLCHDSGPWVDYGTTSSCSKAASFCLSGQNLDLIRVTGIVIMLPGKIYVCFYLKPQNKTKLSVYFSWLKAFWQSFQSTSKIISVVLSFFCFLLFLTKW